MQENGRGGIGQLEYLTDYLEELEATDVLVEYHYADRHFAADHRALYTRSLSQIPNYCTRVHFFSRLAGFNTGRRGAKPALLAALKLRRSGAPRDMPFRYLGFTCLRPLPETPIGTTVLAPYPHLVAKGSERKGADSDARRYFEPVREYRTHPLGCDVGVHGLAFTQQDVGAAACATAALWCSLQNLRVHEELPPSTPADITLRASRNGGQLGRVMPSNGLRLDEICAAVHSFGLSPAVESLENVSRQDWDALIRAALSSQLAPVLLLCRNRDEYHAVTVVGQRSRGGVRVTSPQVAQTRAESFFVHDDRLGPYVRASHQLAPQDLANHPVAKESLRPNNRDQRLIYLRTKRGRRRGEQALSAPDRFEEWFVSYLVVPQHPGVHFTLGELLTGVAPELLRNLIATVGLSNAKMSNRDWQFPFDVWLPRTSYYVAQRTESAMQCLSSETVSELLTAWALPRYLGVVRFYEADPTTRARLDGFVDFLIDSTSTPQNPRAIGVVLSVRPDTLLHTAALSAASAMNLDIVGP